MNNKFIKIDDFIINKSEIKSIGFLKKWQYNDRYEYDVIVYFKNKTNMTLYEKLNFVDKKEKINSIWEKLGEIK